jgi:hypothetical protein
MGPSCRITWQQYQETTLEDCVLLTLLDSNHPNGTWSAPGILLGFVAGKSVMDLQQAVQASVNVNPVFTSCKVQRRKLWKV